MEAFELPSNNAFLISDEPPPIKPRKKNARNKESRTIHMDTTDIIFSQQREEFKGNLEIIEKELIPKYLDKGEEPVSLDVAAMRQKMNSALEKLRPSVRAANMLEEDSLREKAI